MGTRTVRQPAREANLAAVQDELGRQGVELAGMPPSPSPTPLTLRHRPVKKAEGKVLGNQNEGGV